MPIKKRRHDFIGSISKWIMTVAGEVLVIENGGQNHEMVLAAHERVV